MKLSDRINQVGASVTIGITAKAKQMQAEGIDVVSFGAGEPDFDTPEFIKAAAVEALEADDTKYTPRSAVKLRGAIADKLRKENALDYAADQVLVTFGGKHALYELMQILLNPGDKALIPAPYWVSYPEQVKLAGGEPVFLHAGRDQGFKITPQQVLDHADEAKLLILNSPSNPTGVAYTPEELKAVAEAVLQTDLLVISDEIYENLIYGDTTFVSFATLDDRLPERTVTVNGLAKSFSMTGWRLGWAAGPEEIIGGMKRLMSHETTNPVSFAQAGALAAYTDPRAADAIEEMRRAFEKRGTHMAERLNAIDGVECLPPAGAFYCFADFSAHYGRMLGSTEVTDSVSFANACLEEAKVALVPGGAFGEDACARLSFATGLAQIDEGLDRIARLLG